MPKFTDKEMKKILCKEKHYARINDGEIIETQTHDFAESKKFYRM